MDVRVCCDEASSFFFDDVILHPCHIFWVAVGSSAAAAAAAETIWILLCPVCVASVSRSLTPSCRFHHQSYGMIWDSRQSWFWMSSGVGWGAAKEGTVNEVHSLGSVSQVFAKISNPKSVVGDLWRGHQSPLCHQPHDILCISWVISLTFFFFCKIGQWELFWQRLFHRIKFWRCPYEGKP